MLLAGPVSHTSTQYMDSVEVFNILLELSTCYCANFSGCCIVVTLSQSAMTCFLESG